MDFKTFEKFKGKKIIVIGDMMIDRYIYGQTSRISPEAPVPVVKITREEDILGGAANVANNLAVLGAKVYAAGVLGKDKDGALLKGMFKTRKIDTSLLIEDSSRPTIIKKRIISGNNYQLLRLDYENTTSVKNDLEAKFLKSLKEKLKDADALVFSDYAKGLINGPLVKEIIEQAKKHKIPVVVDTKPKHISFFKGCTLITPNLKEAIEMSGEDQDIIKMGKILSSTVQCNVFITRGPEGISVFDKKANHMHIPPSNITKVFDVTGAGDTVVSVATLALSCHLELLDAATVANYAAGIVVQKPGTSVVTPEELKNVYQHEISHYLKESIEVKLEVINKQVDKIEQAAHLFVEAYKRGNKVIAFGNGGSASDAQHLIGELVGRFRLERKALPGVALTTDSAVVTAIANDYGYDSVFERQVEANALKGDVVVAISTSGNSPNVIKAVRKAKELGCKTIGLLGKQGGKILGMCDVEIVVPSDNTPRIQESHIAIIHIICEILDKEFTHAK